jgi:hypothetical protein
MSAAISVNRLRRLAVAALAMLALSGSGAAGASASSSATLYSQDGQWKVQVNAFKNYYLVYSSIGTEVTTYHWEPQRRWYDPWYNFYRWVERPVDSISINNRYTGLTASLSPAAANRSASAYNRSYLEEKLWAVGLGVSMDASADTGLPDSGTAGPCCGAKLDVRGVKSQVSVRIGNEVVSANVAAP